MPRKGTKGAQAQNQESLHRLGELAALAREATTGDVSEDVHLAGRARFVDAVDRETERTSSRVPLRVALAMAAVVALVIGGWGLQKWRAPEWSVEGAEASEGFVRASATSAATIAFADGSAVVLAPAARVRVVRGEHRHVVLEDGRAEVRIARGPMLAWAFDAGPFTVKASQGGLAMAWSGDGEQLDVWPHDAETTVQGGVAGAGITLHGGDHLTARVRQGELRIVRADGAVTTATNAEPALPDPSSNAIVTTTPADTTTAAPPVTPSAPPAISHLPWPALVARGDYDAVLRDADSSGIDGALARRPLADLAALADASRYRGQTDLAQRALSTERTRFPGSKEARTAAFLLGRLADDQSHDAARAIGWYDRYLAEAPTGPFASDALGRKMIAVQATQGPDAARPIAEQYARRFPHGAYAAQAEEIRTR
ncbi:MAG: tetratricopeptide repeat protein [Polyangiaceae bacterium]